MARLYFRIYLAVIGSLVLFALLAGLAWRLTAEGGRFGQRQAFVQAIAEKVAPSAALTPERQKAELQHLREATGFDLALFERDGLLIADASDGVFRLPGGVKGSGGPPPRVHYWRTHHWAQVVPLADGRFIVAARPRAERGELWRFMPVFILLGIGVAVGIAAWPVVRRLTRRLETLQQGVTALGSGDLAARVKVEGKDEIARLAVTFNAAADRIQTLVAANKSLLANASHELRSPLARLRMALETLPPATPDSTRREITRNIHELDQLIDEILLSSRLDADAHPMAQEEIDLVGLVAEECAVTDARLDIRDSGLPMVTGDPRLLRRLIRNLLENAERYGGGAPDVTISQAGQTVTLDVADRGPGVPEAERARIFEPFYRLKGTRESNGGVGLGLALVSEIAAKHGGTVECLPRDGGGSVFRVVLRARPNGPS
jgi:signal transduction histidine kinase